MDESTQKTCSNCGEVKSPTEFHRRTASADGLFASCKACRRAQDAARYAARVTDESRAAGAAKQRARRAALSPEALSEVRVKNAAYMRACYQERSHEILARQAERRAEDPDRYREYARSFAEANPEKKREWDRLYREAHPERRAEADHRRRARILGTRAEKVDVEALWTGLCGICDDPVDRSLLRPHPLSKSLDHITPLSRGGAHSQDNLQWAHLVCNLRKGARLPD